MSVTDIEAKPAGGRRTARSQTIAAAQYRCIAVGSTDEVPAALAYSQRWWRSEVAPAPACMEECAVAIRLRLAHPDPRLTQTHLNHGTRDDV